MWNRVAGKLAMCPHIRAYGGAGRLWVRPKQGPPAPRTSRRSPHRGTGEVCPNVNPVPILNRRNRKVHKMNEQIHAGLSDMMQGTKLALRASIRFAYGWHLAHMMDSEKLFETQLRNAVLGAGKVKSEASRRVKAAKALGKVFEARFGAQLASRWNDADAFATACYLHAAASGVTSEAKLLDWAETGDADATAKAQERKKAEAAEAKARAEAAALDAAQETVQAALARPVAGFDEPQPLPETGSNLEPDAEPAPVTLADRVASLSDADLAALADAVKGELAKRKRDAKALANVAG